MGPPVLQPWYSWLRWTKHLSEIPSMYEGSINKEIWEELATTWASPPLCAAWHQPLVPRALSPWWKDNSDGSLSLQVEVELLLESQVRQGKTPRWVGRPVGWPARGSCPRRCWAFRIPSGLSNFPHAYCSRP